MEQGRDNEVKGLVDDTVLHGFVVEMSGKHPETLLLAGIAAYLYDAHGQHAKEKNVREKMLLARTSRALRCATNSPSDGSEAARGPGWVVEKDAEWV
jgi:hypothetical protein